MRQKTIIFYENRMVDVFVVTKVACSCLTRPKLRLFIELLKAFVNKMAP
jgi:hypothetical protein